MISDYFYSGRPGHPGLGAHWVLFDEHPEDSFAGWARVYGRSDTGRWYDKRGSTVRSFALEQQTNVFTVLQTIEAGLQVKDQDGTPVADRRLANIDGLLRARDTSNVEGRFISKASIEKLDTANLNDNSVTDAILRDSAALSVIGRAANSAGDPADIAAGANDRLLRRVGDALDFGQLTLGMAPANLFTFAKLQQVTGPTVLGKSAAGAGDIAEIAAGADDRVLRRTGGALDFGQLTVGMAANSLWTYAKIQDVSATDRFLGRKTAGAGVIEELTGAEATARLSNFTGDSGAGGVKGLVPAPAAGDAAAGKLLGAGGSWVAPPAASDLKWVATPGDFDISEISDVPIFSEDVDDVVAGDQIVVEAYFQILNSSGAGRTYIGNVDFDGAYGCRITTGSLGSSTDLHWFHLKALLTVISSSEAVMMLQKDGRAVTAQASGANDTMTAAHLDGKTWETDGGDLTGTVTVTFAIQSSDASPTQTLKLRHATIRKFTPS